MLQTAVPEVLISTSLTEPIVVLTVSEGVSQLLGYKPDNFLAGNVCFRQLIHFDDQDIAENIFSRVLSPATGNFNIRLRQANGRIRCVKGHFTKVRDAFSHTLNLQLLDAKSLYQVNQPIEPHL